jgi:hypothetical protein
MPSLKSPLRGIKGHDGKTYGEVVEIKIKWLKWTDMGMGIK